MTVCVLWLLLVFHRPLQSGISWQAWLQDQNHEPGQEGYYCCYGDEKLSVFKPDRTQVTEKGITRIRGPSLPTVGGNLYHCQRTKLDHLSICFDACFYAKLGKGTIILAAQIGQ